LSVGLCELGKIGSGEEISKAASQQRACIARTQRGVGRFSAEQDRYRASGILQEQIVGGKRAVDQAKVAALRR
jgi:hypothetical protein